MKTKMSRSRKIAALKFHLDVKGRVDRKKGDFDLRSAAWSRGNAGQFDRAQEPVVFGELTFSLEHAKGDGGLVIMNSRKKERLTVRS